MAYLPETKDKTAVVSPAAKRVLGPEDPAAREEFDAQKKRKFDTWDQVGLGADMLPAGAVAYKGGSNVFKLINDAVSAVKKGGLEEAKKTVLNWATTHNYKPLLDAINYFDNMKKGAGDLSTADIPADELDDLITAEKALTDVYDKFFAPDVLHLGGSSPAKPSLSPAAKEALKGSKPPRKELIEKTRADYGGVEASKKTTDIMATKDLPSETRMRARDMPSPSGKGRLDQRSVHGKAPLDDLGQMVSDVKGFDDAKLNSEVERVKALFEQVKDPLYHTRYDSSALARLDRYYTLLLDEIKRRGL